MACLLGRKIAMTQTFGPDGELIPVTVIQAGPCKVVDKRTDDKNGYKSVVIGFEEVEGAKLKSKPLLGFFKKQGTPCFRILKEFRDLDMEVGTDLNVSQFNAGDRILVQGTSKGKGFANVIKKWNFGTGRESHGGNCQRKIGSTGMHTWPAHVIKGKKMPGRLGNEQITLQAVEVVRVIPEENLLLIKGPVPGVTEGLVSFFKAA
jgi:large subunit ribosomal protein L3